MAVDYLHRILVAGRADRVRDFRRRIYREYPRTVAGFTWTEIVWFSFAALYEIAPRARTVEPEVPYDPYDLSAWPVTRIGARSGWCATSSTPATSRWRRSSACWQEPSPT